MVAIVSSVVELWLGTWVYQTNRNNHRYSNITSAPHLRTACSYHPKWITVTFFVLSQLYTQLQAFLTNQKHSNSISAYDRSIPASKWTCQIRFCNSWTCAVHSIDRVLCFGDNGLPTTLWAMASDKICLLEWHWTWKHILKVFLDQVFHAIFAATIVFMVLKTRHRSYEWMTEERLFTSGLKVCPNNAKVRNCLSCFTLRINLRKLNAVEKQHISYFLNWGVNRFIGPFWVSVSSWEII